MMKGLFGRCLNHETTLGRLREKANVTEHELAQLQAWKVIQEKKLKMAEEAWDQYLEMTDKMRKTIEEKDEELRRAKEVAVLEYRDSEALLTELGVSYADGFDEALRQVKALYPKLDLASVNIDAAGQTSVQPAPSEDTEEIFGEKAAPDAHLDQAFGDSDPKEGSARLAEENQAPVVE